MAIAITYSEIPSFGEARSLHMQHDGTGDSNIKYWTHFGGISADAPAAINPHHQEHPEQLNEQTTKIILNLLKGLQIQAVPEFVMGKEGTIYELELHSGVNKAKYVWWEDLPNEWIALSTLVAYLKGFVEGSQ